ncbi:hypothetical protein CR513_56450, partial [Mucuna pruriens]
MLGNGIGTTLPSLEVQYFPFLTKLGFDCTNIMAEYEACAIGITMAIKHQVKRLKETRDPKLIPYHSHVTTMGEQFDKISFHYVPRDENQIADALATLSSML